MRCNARQVVMATGLLAALSTAALGQVDTAWVRRYSGPGNSTNQAYALAVDGQGNVYVTGFSVSFDTAPYYFDYATIKYSPTGEELWVRRYNGPGNENDAAHALAVDEQGNVYVTGWSVGSNTGPDYATIKYSPDGDELWVRRYNGPGNSGDLAYALAVDGQGNVYVTGHSWGSGTGFDYATIKYSPDGAELWVRRYNGPENDLDVATVLAVDSQGNVYVTGWSRGDGTGFDYATVKYSPDGNELWVRRYNGPGNDGDEATALAVDGLGNVYVTGESRGSGTLDDYATVKYSPTGEELWVRRYSRPGRGHDWARALAVDEQGNVYVTGSSRGYATIKYSPDGEELWVARYNGPGNGPDCATALAVDVQGNVYVTGCSYGSGTRDDYATVKYSPAGEELWVARYNGPGNREDHAYALAVDGEGNVYVTGYSIGSGTGIDYATIKYMQGIGVAGEGIPGCRPHIALGPNPLVGGIAILRLEGLGHNPKSQKDLGYVPRLTVSVYDVSGRNVLSRSLVTGDWTSGIPLDLRQVRAGVYLVKLEAGGFTATRKLVKAE